MKSKKEKQYTSTSVKLLNNLDLLKDLQKGVFRPQSIQLAPTDECNLNCIMCSVKNREMKELTLDECKMVLDSFKDLGAKTVENSGGGDFTCYPYINELIEYEHKKGYKIGGITNGVVLNKKVKYENLKKFTWVRVSLNCLDYVKEITLNIPDNVYLGFSYVWTSLSNFDMLDKLNDYVKKYNAKYIRIVPNCLSIKDIESYKEKIRDKVKEYDKFFLQEKEYCVPETCRIGYIKPFVNSDGFIYHCSANPLIDRKFNAKFRMGHISEIKEIWKPGNIKVFDTSNCQKGKCFFKEHNDLIEAVLTDTPHKDFI